MNSLPPFSDAIVVGAGFAGLSAAATLASSGKSVTVLERHEQAGGRARAFAHEGFTFDMGPSWYWMPDVFEDFFGALGSEVNDHLDLIRLDPSYRVWFDSGPVDIPAGSAAVQDLFESMEVGAGEKFRRFLIEAGRKYELGMGRFVRQAGHTPLELLQPSILPQAAGLSLFGSLSKHVRRNFSDPRIIQILEFPVLFLGARPSNTPALYSMMNYADTALGTWYPMGGMNRIVNAMESEATRQGVQFHYGVDVEEILESGGRAIGVVAEGRTCLSDTVVAAADYHHVEQDLLSKEWRRYDESYWQGRTMAPSSLLFYLGIEKRIDQFEHHNLFFDSPFEPHAETIYDDPSWPEHPLFYVCAPSRTDASVAPPGCENLFILIPLAPGLAHDESEQERLFGDVMDRIQMRTGEDLRPHIVFRRDYAHREFENDYNAFRGNAYGLANTIGQTAFLKPKMRSKLPGLFFAGQLTAPGPGVPPSLISGQLAAEEANEWLSQFAHGQAIPA